MEFREIHNKIMFLRYNGPQYPTHLHEDIELIFTIKGGANAYCNGVCYTLKDGDVFLAFPNTPHYYINKEKGDYILLLIKASHLLSYANIFLDYEPVSAVVNLGDDKDEILYLLETALNEYKANGYDAILDAYFTLIIGKILKHYQIQKVGISENKISKILYYCSKHYKESISIESVANALNISKSTVSHTFSSKLKIGFCQYLNSIRLTEARLLLRNTDMSITDIAQSVGFETIRTFNRAFLKDRGISPSQYRKKHKGSKK